jgi:succinyl-diaminopimelate desuccinylase
MAAVETSVTADELRELTEEVVELTRGLVAIDTDNPPGAELAAAKWVANELERAGVEVTLQPFGDERANLLARIHGRGKRPALVLSGHLDTVPIGPGAWARPPRDGVVEDGRIYGRGVLDMKGPVAAMLVALRHLHATGRTPEGDVMLALTAGEETDSCGARLMAESGLLDGAGLMIIGEPTNFDVGVAHRGALWVRVETSGQRGHGSRPSRDGNAICKLLDWLAPFDELERLVTGEPDPLLGQGSLSLNMIGGGDAPNVVPDAAAATLDFRTVPGQSHEEILRQLRERAGEAIVTVLRDAPPVSGAEGSDLARAVEKAVACATGRSAGVRGLRYVTDASAFAACLDLSVVIVGPGREEQAHTVDEHVEVQALARACVLFRRIAETTMYGD